MKEELFTLRKEIKYVISLQQAFVLKNTLDHFLMRDRYCADCAYSIRSLYFDSINNIDFSEKLAGADNRKKVRLRIYNGDASFCKLELKAKRGDCQQKMSFLISKADAEAVSYGRYNVIKNYFHKADAAIQVYSIMEQGRYKPVVLMEYDRIAYQYSMYDTRITIDRNIRSTESDFNIFSQAVRYRPVMYENAVLEIKYSGKLMGFLSDILSRFDLTQSACSKYCAGRRVYFDFNY